MEAIGILLTHRVIEAYSVEKLIFFLLAKEGTLFLRQVKGTYVLFLFVFLPALGALFAVRRFVGSLDLRGLGLAEVFDVSFEAPLSYVRQILAFGVDVLPEALISTISLNQRHVLVSILI